MAQQLRMRIRNIAHKKQICSKTIGRKRIYIIRVVGGYTPTIVTVPVVIQILQYINLREKD